MSINIHFKVIIIVQLSSKILLFPRFVYILAKKTTEWCVKKFSVIRYKRKGGGNAILETRQTLTNVTKEINQP